jgi:hypothetical protein
MNEYQSGGGDKNNDLKLFPLRNEDLVFSKNSDGVLSCGYKVSNALLNATLSVPMIGGGGGGGSNKSPKKENGKNKKNEIEPKTAKIMEDLVIPSSLYYGKPTSNSKVFNYKKGKRDKDKNKDKKGRDSSSDNDSDDDVIEESLYDKLLSLVSIDKKVKYDKKTRKHADGRGKINIKKDGKSANDEDVNKNEKENENKNKNKNKKTKKVRFNL